MIVEKTHHQLTKKKRSIKLKKKEVKYIQREREIIRNTILK